MDNRIKAIGFGFVCGAAGGAIVLITIFSLNQPKPQDAKQITPATAVAAKADSVLRLMKLENKNLLKQGFSHTDTACGPVREIVFVKDRLKYRIWDNGNLCEPGLRFYVRRYRSPNAGPRNEENIVFDYGPDGVVDRGEISGQWANFTAGISNIPEARHTFARGKRGHPSQGSSFSSGWQKVYEQYLTVTLAALRPRD